MFFPAHLLWGRSVRLICLGVIALRSVTLAAAPAPPVQPAPEGALLALAQKKFGTLSPAEEELFRAAQDGRATFVLSTEKKENDPSDRAVVRAECIVWICTDAQASALVSHQGLQLWGMLIDGALDLSNAEIKFWFQVSKCTFSGNIDLRDAHLRGLNFIDSRIKGLNANRATIDSSVSLRGGLRGEGEINLIGSKIGGNLDCSGAEFWNHRGLALNAEAAKIEGRVILDKGFRAEGGVNLVGATISGDLDCQGGRFLSAKGPALNAEGAKIGGSVFLRRSVDEGSEVVTPFEAKGAVSLLGATIEGDLDCHGGQFSNVEGPAPKGQFSSGARPALNANAANIKGSVYLRGGFRSEGEVNLVRATIGDLQIREIVKTDQFFLDLRLAKVETMWDEEPSWPGEGKLFLDGFRYERLYQGAPLEAGSRKRWLNLQKRDKFRSQPYEHLATVLREMGHDREARQVMIEKNRERARFTDFPHGDWWWYNFFGRFIGYGYEPWRALAASLVMIVFGAYLFRDGFTHGLIEPTEENAYAKKPDGQVIEEKGRPKISKKYPVFNAFIYSFESFAPLLNLDQSGNWTPNANRGAKISVLPFWSPRAGSLLRGYLYFHIAAGWLFTTLWVGAVTGLVKT